MSSLREADGEASVLDGSSDVRRYSRVGDTGIGGGGVGLRSTSFPERSGRLEEGDRELRGGLLDGME
jgi:hypothetical protein